MSIRLALCFSWSNRASAAVPGGGGRTARFPGGRARRWTRASSSSASANALVLDANAGQPIYAKGADTVTPIASVTKLMTAMVVLDAGQSLDETISVDVGDVDLLKGSHSRLRLGAELSRREMLRLALMASENRAASSPGPALSRRHRSLRRGDESEGAGAWA